MYPSLLIITFGMKKARLTPIAAIKNISTWMKNIHNICKIIVVMN